MIASSPSTAAATAGEADATAAPALEKELRRFVAQKVPADDVDDVVQDVFVRLQRSVGALRSAERFGPWVYRIAQSAVADHWRARRRHPLPLEAPDTEHALAEPPLSPPEADDDEAAAALAACIPVFVAMLPSPYREALTLTELQGMTQRDAAELLGVSHSGMKSRVQRGRERLRALFDRCCTFAIDARGRVSEFTPRTTCCPSPKPSP